MTIANTAVNIYRNTDGLSRLALANTTGSPAYLPLEEEQKMEIEEINITEIGIELFEEVRGSYKQDNNFHTLTSLLDKDCKDTELAN
ncbi:hypothetical protein O181_011202 [Austropuccinia psidii MF-1]|uniref:Uncharacterized protein n=1 Tax=Austropuccinia psidii MF-1 TaxID=1389203 RepID=A0A9Q3BU29_9BASI|nr:hypothetical protein [Austropuccinia psidii MF-1]